jgi:hypothetical protein
VRKENRGSGNGTQCCAVSRCRRKDCRPASLRLVRDHHTRLPLPASPVSPNAGVIPRTPDASLTPRAPCATDTPRMPNASLTPRAPNAEGVSEYIPGLGAKRPTPGPPPRPCGLPQRGCGFWEAGSRRNIQHLSLWRVPLWPSRGARSGMSDSPCPDGGKASNVGCFDVTLIRIGATVISVSAG